MLMRPKAEDAGVFKPSELACLPGRPRGSNHARRPGGADIAGDVSWPRDAGDAGRTGRAGPPPQDHSHQRDSRTSRASCAGRPTSGARRHRPGRLLQLCQSVGCARGADTSWACCPSGTQSRLWACGARGPCGSGNASTRGNLSRRSARCARAGPAACSACARRGCCPVGPVGPSPRSSTSVAGKARQA